MRPIVAFLSGGIARQNPPRGLRVLLSRRPVENTGAPFVPSQEVFTDVASVRDELGLLHASQGPTVVRVQVDGGAPEDREALAGDWLVDPDGGDRVLRLPEPRWDCDEEATAWTRGRSWLEAWETCEDGRWMLDAASKAGVDRRLIILAACICARTTLRFVPSDDSEPLKNIELAERWARGEATPEEVKSVVIASNEAIDSAFASDIHQWAAQAALVCVHAAHAAALRWTTAPHWGGNAAYSAIYVADVWSILYGGSKQDSSTYFVNFAKGLVHSADAVRRGLPTLTVLRAAAGKTLEWLD